MASTSTRPGSMSRKNTDETIDAIQNALDNDQFRLLFQPIINLRGEGEEHYEAFVRMLDSNGTEISPYDFLPLADRPKWPSKSIAG